MLRLMPVQSHESGARQVVVLGCGRKQPRSTSSAVLSVQVPLVAESNKWPVCADIEALQNVHILRLTLLPLFAVSLFVRRHCQRA